LKLCNLETLRPFLEVIAMRKYIAASIAMLPFLLTWAYAAQNGSVDSPAQAWIFSSDDSGSTSYLGVDIADVTSERLSALKLREEKGAEVTMVDQDAPAGKAGIKEHDVILTLNGTSVESAAQLRRMIHETPAGRIITLGLSRDGQPMTVKVQLGDRHKEFGMMNNKEFHIEVPPIPPIPDIDIPAISVVMTSSARSGLTVENITPQLGDFFGVKNGEGVLVRSVEKGSRAEKAGFHAGDVIVKVNDQRVHDTSDFSTAVRSRSGNSVSVGVIRDKREQNLNLELPEHRHSGEMFEDESSADDLLMQAQSAKLSDLREEMAKLRPQIEMASRQAAESSRKAVEEARKSLCTERKKIHEQSEEQRKQLRQEQEQLRHEMERMRRELRHSLAEI
jgi:serine protease Do